MVDLGPVGPGGRRSPGPAPAARLLIDAFGRISDSVEGVLEGLDGTHLTARPAAGANPIGWLVWHLTRIQDDHLAGGFGHEQVWTAGSWHDRFGLPFEAGATGYGHDAEEVGAVRVGGDLLRDYHRAVFEQTRHSLESMPEHDLERVVDESWDPPVTLGVRLISVVADDLEHAGQAAYVRGLLERGGELGLTG